MESGTHNPGAGANAAHRPELYRELRKRNERRARVARLIEVERERHLRVASVIQEQRTRRFQRSG